MTFFQDGSITVNVPNGSGLMEEQTFLDEKEFIAKFELPKTRNSTSRELLHLRCRIVSKNLKKKPRKIS